MRRTNLWKRLSVLAGLFLLCLPSSFAQSLLTGAISGTVADASGAVIQKANVTLKSLDTGSTQATTSGAVGEFTFSLLPTGRYHLTVTHPGFEKTERDVVVAVGQTVTANLAMTVGQSTQTIEVSEAAPLLNPDPSNSTNFSPAEVQQLPSPGGDITTIAFTAPGVVVSAMGGYGNFTVNGLPATSNLFTVNGENDMDPYFNINNTGATNLTLGSNEIQEATVVSNPYDGQYGQLSGAQVSFVTKGGTNQFHGNADYYWNGRDMNANDWFSNFYGAPRPFANANQWGTSLGGPIRKDKTFFFVNYEGLRFVLPNVDSVTIPTPAFASAVLANVTALQPAEAGTYQKMFNLWANAPGAAGAQAIPNDSYCSSVVVPGFDPTTQACAARFVATPTTLASEWILGGRVDQVIGTKDNLFFRYRGDHGLQPTSLSPISSAFNAISSQPAYDFQLHETHIFGPTATNSFTASLSHYIAQFQQDYSAASSAFPYGLITSGSVPFTGFNPIYEFPQGRNITQYQFIDDFTLVKGAHTLKFGENFRRYDVSDHNFFFNTPTVYFGYNTAGLQNFADGLAYQYRQSLNLASDVPVAMWGMGAYAQDEWRVKSNLKVTLALRVEHNSNPVCQYNCFANFSGPFSGLPSVTNADPGSVPYSSDIVYNQHKAYQGVDALNLSPRIGFSWSPGKDGKTVVSGGFGIFYDNAPAGLVDNLLANPPVSVAIRVRPSAGVLPFDPAGGAATWAASANAFNISKSYNQISSQLSALGSVFNSPAFDSIQGTLHSPQVQEWNISVQRQLTGSLMLNLNYVGNHAIRIPYGNEWPNAFDGYCLYYTAAGCGVPGIPEAPIVPNYGTVNVVQSGAISSYNGLNVTVTKRFSHSVEGHFNYTWSHNLDEDSNGGIFTYGDGVQTQINPNSLKAGNYGNSDYDIRNNFSTDVLVNPTIHSGSSMLQKIVNGWQFSAKVYWRTGFPFSVNDDNWAGAFVNGTTYIAAYPSGQGPVQTSCGSAAAVTPCLNAGAWINSASATFEGYTAISPQSRNQFRGPHYFDTDMNLYRNFKFKERVNLAIGIQAFNVFNHPNFGLPDSGLGDASFGQVLGMAGTPTSPYGAFLGFDSSPRIAQLSGKITF